MNAHFKPDRAGGAESTKDKASGQAGFVEAKRTSSTVNCAAISAAHQEAPVRKPQPEHGDSRDSFRAAILATLGHAPDVIEPGRLQRFATIDRRGDDAGWCKLFNDRRAGVYGCHRQGISETWSATDRSTMTRAQRVELARQVAASTAPNAKPSSASSGPTTRSAAPACGPSACRWYSAIRPPCT